MADYGIDPFGKLMEAERMIAQDKFQRQKYDDLMQRQMQADTLAATDRQQRIDATNLIPNELQAQYDVQAEAPGVALPIDPQRAMFDAYRGSGGNPYAMGEINKYDKLMNPKVGGGVSYKNAKRDDGSLGIFGIRPTGETFDTGLDVEAKSYSGDMSLAESDIFAKKIAAGELDINTMPKRGAGRKAIILALENLVPGFNLVEAEANARYFKDLSNLRSVGLIAGVEPLFDNLTKMGNKLDNTGIPLWNKIKNAAGEATGDADIVAFNNARDDFVAEAERILLGSGVLSDSKYNRALGNLNSAQSPEQMQAAIDQIRKVIVAREEALKNSPYQPQGQPEPATAPPATGGIKFLGFE